MQFGKSLARGGKCESRRSDPKTIKPLLCSRRFSNGLYFRGQQMKKIYLKIGKHKIDITEDLKKEVSTFSAGGGDIAEAFDNAILGRWKVEKHIQTLEDLIFDMTILIRDKENDFEGFSRVFTAKPAQHKKGEEFSMVCGSWIDRVLI